jgi:phospholipid/cholesterol/gamma-HCH transport system substrate-binding protein
MIGIETLMGGKEGQEGELQLAAKSFRTLADNLDKRTAGLFLDSRRTLADISRAVNNFDRNPTRVIFGASARDAPPPPLPASRNPADARARIPGR